jgi:hypothetical protein
MPYGTLIGTGASVATEAAMEVDAPEATPIPPTKKEGPGGDSGVSDD